MSKIIIENRSNIVTDRMCLQMVSAVMKDGRVSNYGKQYCYGSTFTIGDEQVMVASSLNKKSDKFVIYDNGKYWVKDNDA